MIAIAPIATPLAAPGRPTPDGHDLTTCPNLCCADRRRAAGLAPLRGLPVLPMSVQDRIDDERRRPGR